MMSERRPLSWRLVIAGIVLAIVVFWLLVSLSLSVSWPAWTGFVDFTTPKSDALDYHPGRTLWDWLGLLVVPAVLVVGGYFFSRSERASDNAIAERRIVEDRKIAEEQRLEDRKIAQERLLEDRIIVEEQRSEDRRIEAERIAEERNLQADRTRDSLLREYLDRMSDLLITHKLGSSNKEDPQRFVARARTVTILNALDEDGARKGHIVRFLYEAKLLNKDNPVVNLKEANLRASDLTRTNLIKADLSGANLSGADLRVADLRVADLRRANLIGADLRKANLIGADLSGADLRVADLSGANLTKADLRGVYLDDAVLSRAVLANANLKNTRVTREQLKSAANLEGAILP